MKYGVRLEQPMPETTTTSFRWSWREASALYVADSTPKSPQPGHQTGLSPLLYSLTVRTSASCVPTTLAPSGMSQDLLDLDVDFARRERQAADLVQTDRPYAQGGGEVVGELALVVYLRHQDVLHGAHELAQTLGRQWVERPRVHGGDLEPFAEPAVHALPHAALR